MEAEKHRNILIFAAPGAEACGALRTIAAHKIRMRKVAEHLRKLCR